MGVSTDIAWTDHTFNPWWGCERVSPGCTNCYAEAFSRRTGHDIWGGKAERRFFGEKHWREPLKWNAAAEREGVRRRVFCASMADVFEDRPDLKSPRARLFEMMYETPWLDWQVLTKRPENICDLAPVRWATSTNAAGNVLRADVVPIPNVWWGTTVEDQQRAAERIPHLLSVPWGLRFLSIEPLLGPVTIPPGVLGVRGHLAETFGNRLVHWVIVGGESGPKRRPFDPAWAESIADQCEAAGVPLFVKQDGGPYPGKQGRLSNALWARKEFPTPERAGARSGG